MSVERKQSSSEEAPPPCTLLPPNKNKNKTIYVMLTCSFQTGFVTSPISHSQLCLISPALTAFSFQCCRHAISRLLLPLPSPQFIPHPRPPPTHGPSPVAPLSCPNFDLHSHPPPPFCFFYFNLRRQNN